MSSPPAVLPPEPASAPAKGPRVLPELPDELWTTLLSFCGLPELHSARLSSKLLAEASPSPYIWAARVLAKANAFDICSECEGRITAFTPRSIKYCNKCNEFESMSEAEDEVTLAFSRSDPRRTPLYWDLMEKVTSRRFETWKDAEKGESGMLFRLMLDFCRRSVHRLERNFKQEIWSALHVSDVVFPFHVPSPKEIHVTEPGNSDAENAFETEMAMLGESRYKIMWTLARFNVAVKELYGKSPVYHYLEDRGNAEGVITICTSGGSSERHENCSFVQGLWGLYEAFEGNSVDELKHSKPGSDAHLWYLLQASPPSALIESFGIDFVTRNLDPMEAFRRAWPDLRSIVDERDAGTLTNKDATRARFEGAFAFLPEYNFMGDEEHEDEGEAED